MNLVQKSRSRIHGDFQTGAAQRFAGYHQCFKVSGLSLSQPVGFPNVVIACSCIGMAGVVLLCFVKGGQKPDAKRMLQKKNMYLNREQLPTYEPRKKRMNAFRKRTYKSKNWELEEKAPGKTWVGAPLNREHDRYGSSMAIARHFLFKQFCSALIAPMSVCTDIWHLWQ